MSQENIRRSAVRSFRRAPSRQSIPNAPRSRKRPHTFWPQYAGISPFFLLFALFGLFPVLFSAFLAFHRWNGLDPITFVGFKQFAFVLADATFRSAVVNTLIIWVLATIPMLVMSLGLAALLNSVKRFRGVYQVVFFLPSVTSIVAIAIFFKAIFDNRYGIVNAALHALGLPQIAWLDGYWTIKIVIALLMTWQWVGYNAIIYYAGLQAIPKDVYEAAKMDGAGPLRTFWSITVPLLRPIILFTVVISTINGLQSFAEPQVLFGTNAATNANSGGPGGAGLTMVLYFYQQAFTNNNFGYGAALAYAIFAIVGLFALINWRLVARSEK